MRAPVLLAASLVLVGCETVRVTHIDEPPLQHKYPVAEGASPACVDAATRARKYCRDQRVASDATYSRLCNEAQWDYSRTCR